MLVQGLTMNTGIEGAIGLATDFKDIYKEMLARYEHFAKARS